MQEFLVKFFTPPHATRVSFTTERVWPSLPVTRVTIETRSRRGSPRSGNFGGSVQRAFAGKTSMSLLYVPPPRQGPPPVISRPRGGRLGKCYKVSKPPFKNGIQGKGLQGGQYYVNGFDSRILSILSLEQARSMWWRRRRGRRAILVRFNQGALAITSLKVN